MSAHASESDSMDRTTFESFKQIVYEQSGIALGENKEALVSARVGKRMRALGYEDIKQYLKHVLDDSSGQELVHLLDSISTNVTSFFREPDHFDFLGKVLADWASRGQRRFRMWSAACSTGEEPYSMAITALDSGICATADVKILATDISTRVLESSQQGEYDSRKLDGMNSVLKERHFDKVKMGEETIYRVKEPLKRLVVFKRLNLSVTPFPMRGPLDVVFCRNVMIYFDNVVRRRLLEELYRLLRPDGYLMVGHAESLTGIVSQFRGIRPSVYTK